MKRGQNLIDLPTILATFIRLFASIYGFMLQWDLTIWELMGITMVLDWV